MKECEFMSKQIRNKGIDPKKWLQRYVFIDSHDIFFVEFPIILDEWFSRLLKNVINWCITVPYYWNPKLIQGVNWINNKVLCTINF